MKIIHCADIHLDSRMTANLDKDKAKERKNEILASFIRMTEYAGNNDVKAIIIAGDLFDVKRISATARNAVYNAIADLPQIDFYYLRGNHDADGFINSFDELPKNIKLFSEEWTSYNMEENIVISGVELNSVNKKDIYNSLTLNRNRFNIVVLHGQESEHSSKKDAEIIALKELRNRGINYLALGHIHSYKREALDAEGIYCYSGCLEARGFDEGGEHGFVLLDIDTATGTFTDSFIPFAMRTLYVQKIDITGCMSSKDIEERVMSELDKLDATAMDMVEVILTGEADVECEKDTDLIARIYGNRYYFFKIKDKSGYSLDYTQYTHDESLKGEFVRTVMNDDSLEEDDKAAVIRYGIKALIGEELV